MKNTIQILVKASVCLMLIFCATMCKKDDRLEYLGPIDPTKDPSGFCKALNIEGTNKGGELPSRTVSGFRITNAQSSALAAQGANLYIPFTFTASEPIAGIYMKIEGADNYWEIPVKGQVSGGSYVFTVGIPRNVLAGKSRIQYNAYNAKGETTNTISMNTEVALSRDACAEGLYRESGSQGLTVRRLILGDMAGEIIINYEMYSLPDRLDIQYNGEWVASTAPTVLGKDQTPPPSVCFDRTVGYVPNRGTLKVNYDPAKSKEIVIYMSGCFGATAWDISVQCPAAGCNPAAYLTQSYTIPASQEGAFSTGIRVNNGDYVFFNARGKGMVYGPNNDWVYANGTDEYFDPIRLKSITYPDDLKKFKNFRFGQMLLKVNGNIQGGADSYKLKATECLAVEKWINNVTFPIGNYGNYFIANSTGIIELEINDMDPSDNKSGRYEVEVWVMTPQAHQNRNDCNRCSRTEPVQSSTLGPYLDKLTPPNEWEKSLLEEWFSADCFHGGHTAFRGLSESVKGCQCVYDKTSKALINTPGIVLGTYDYGPPKSKEHVILDVFTHEAFLARNPSFRYKATTNVY
jgi:hypothetical protein